MSKKLEYEFVKKQFEERDYVLLETKYINSKTKMKYICKKHPDNGIQYIQYNDLRQGHGCVICGYEESTNKRKLSYDFVKNEFKKRNYILLDNIYINSKSPLQYTCIKHPDIIQTITYERLRIGRGCEKCSKKRKLNLEIVKEEFIERGYQLLEKEYIDSKTKMKYICSNHPEHIQEINYSCFYQGHGCIYCTGRRRLNIDIIRSEFIDRGYILLSKEYKNAFSPLEYICLKHPEHIQTVKYGNFKQQGACHYCGMENTKEGLKLEYQYVLEEFNKRDYKLLETEYINSTIPMKYICSRHTDEIQDISYANLKQGSGCYYCGLERRIEKNSGSNNYNWQGGITSLNQYLRNYITPWYIDTIKKYNYKCIITNKRFEEVHHLYSFSNIAKQVLEICDLKISTVSEITEKDLNMLKNICLELHYKYGLGVPLTKEMHSEFHFIYGKYNNTPEQFEEFRLFKINQPKENLFI